MFELKKRNLIILGIVILLAGCLSSTASNTTSPLATEKANSLVVPTPFPDSPLPLKIGNEWTYSYKWSGDPSTTYKRTYTITNTEIIDGKTTFVLLTEMDGNSFSQDWFYENDDGLFIVKRQLTGSSVQKFSGESAVFSKRNKDSGDKWEYTLVSGGHDIQVINENLGLETVKTPVGEFEAYKIKSTQTVNLPDGPTSSISTYWFALGVGIVKEGSSELLNYTLK